MCMVTGIGARACSGYVRGGGAGEVRRLLSGAAGKADPYVTTAPPHMVSRPGRAVRLHRSHALRGDRKDNPMRIINVHHAWSPPPRTRRAVLIPLGIIVVTVACASVIGHGTAVLVVIGTALLTVVAEELVRIAMRYWLRTV